MSSSQVAAASLIAYAICHLMCHLTFLATGWMIFIDRMQPVNKESVGDLQLQSCQDQIDPMNEKVQSINLIE